VSGEASDHAFVLAAQGQVRTPITLSGVPATGFYLLKIDPTATAASRTTLGPLPVRLSKGTVLNGMAVTPDGTRLAVTTTSSRQPGLIAPRLHVFDLVTGTERTWQGQVYGGAAITYQGMVSAAADDRRLALIGTGLRANDFRLLVLDTARPGSGLLADSKAIALPGTTYSHGEPPVTWRDAVITPDGQTVVVVVEIARTGHDVYQRLEKISVSAGKPASTLSYTDAGLYDQVLWTSQNGHVLVVMTGRHRDGTGIYTGTRFTPIRWPGGTLTAAW
jgi:hypothetical protein